ncbi:MAG: tyrosine-type recombinase/integrase [Flavobacteriales bacterium]|nr:tyrosine-type recombinase/integrase [Flavobacteriales bacterium]
MTTHNEISAFKEYLLIEKNYSEHTAVAYIKDIEQFLLFLSSELELAQENVSNKEMRYWIVWMRKKELAIRSINRKIASVKAYFKFLQQINTRIDNPARGLKALKVPKRLPSFYHNDEIAKLLEMEIYGEGLLAKRDYLIILLLYSTGIRRAELINLKERDIDFSRQQIKILGKGNKERYVYLTNELIRALRLYLEEKKASDFSSCEALFFTKKGKKMYPKFVYDLVNDYLSYVAKGRKKGPHVLRHSYATEMMNQEVDLQSIKESMGHSSISATQVYTHNSKERLLKEYKSFHPRGGTKK